MDESELLDIKSDYIFKLVFGSEKNKRILISLLNAIFQGDPQVRDLKILNPEIPKILRKGKSVRLDVRADIGEEKFVDVEIQAAGILDAADRALQYLAHMMVEHSKSPNHLKKALPKDAVLDYRYPKVIGIWIFGNNVSSRKSALNKAQMTFEKNTQEDYEIMTKNARIIFIELPKFNPKKAGRHDILNAWLTFLKNPADSGTHKISEIEEAYETLKVVSADEKVRRTYQAIREKEMDVLNEKRAAHEMGLEEGEKIGIEKGRAEGKAEGEKIGIEKTKIQSAKKMLSDGLAVDLVSKYSGLSVEEVRKLK